MINAVAAGLTDLAAVPAGVCGPRTDAVCGWVYDHTNGNVFAARASDWVVGRPLAIAAVLLVSWLLHLLIRHVVSRGVRRLMNRPLLPASLPPDVGSVPSAPPEPTIQGLDEDEYEVVPTREDARRTTRAHAVATAVSSTLSGIVWVLAFIVILGILGLDLEPIIAGAGLAGVALAFGAQSLIKDLLSGLFILLEDHYGIGDMIHLDEAFGVVEKMTLRHTVLRDFDGAVWYVRNGEIDKVRNMSQVWSGVLIDVSVVYGTDIAAARTILYDAADAVTEMSPYDKEVLGPPEVLGVQSLDEDGVTLRVMVKTLAGRQLGLHRQLLETINDAFDQHGVQISTRRVQLNPARTLSAAGEMPPARSSAADPPQVIIPRGWIKPVEQDE